MTKFFKGWRKISVRKNNSELSEQLRNYFSKIDGGIAVGKFTISAVEDAYPKFTKKSIIK